MERPQVDIQGQILLKSSTIGDGVDDSDDYVPRFAKFGQLDGEECKGMREIRRILVVEDNRYNLEAITTMLAQY